MTSFHSRRDDSADRPSDGLDDLIARHFEGGLDAVEQRQLAALLEASPEARATLARYLRLEAGLIRIASAGLVGRQRGGDAGAMLHTPPVAASRGPRANALALAGGLLAAMVLAMLAVGRLGGVRPQVGDVAIVADRWLELRSAARNAEFEPQGPEGQESEGDDSGSTSESPPAWLVAAVADEDAGQPPPDEG